MSAVCNVDCPAEYLRGDNKINIKDILNLSPCFRKMANLHLLNGIIARRCHVACFGESITQIFPDLPLVIENWTLGDKARLFEAKGI